MSFRSLFVKNAGICIIGMLAATSTLGCSKGPPVGIVHGTVTLDGNPLEEGAVQLTALDGHAPTYGAQIVGGKFKTSAAIAKYRVEIESNVMRGPNGEKPDLTKKVDKFADNPGFKVVSLVPEKYNKKSTLELDVQAGNNERVFDLKSK